MALSSALSLSNHPLAKPAVPGSFEDLPGNQTCVSCRFFLSLLIVGSECGLLYATMRFLLRIGGCSEALWIRLPQEQDYRSKCGVITSFFGTLLALLGWALFGCIFWFFWNFVSYMVLVGPLLVFPSIFIAYMRGTEPAPQRKTNLWRRIKLGGWLVGVMTFVLFPNVLVLPEQMSRHVHMSRSTITPFDPLVQDLKNKFYAEVPRSTFKNMTFADRMSAVDDFIFRTVKWKSDLSQYGVIGLLVSPHEVLSRMAGDCQGQAATTTSLLFALGGVQAFCVETPFHWWTHSVDIETGKTYDLNVHGQAGFHGSVVPQPVDMMYTWFPPSCNLTESTCDDESAYNRETMVYLAPPHRALMIAWTSTHEFKRDVLPSVSALVMIAVGMALGVVLAAYAIQFNLNLIPCTPAVEKQLLLRCLLACPACVFITLFTLVWGKYVYYPAVFMHMSGCLTFTLSYLCLTPVLHAPLWSAAPSAPSVSPRQLQNQYIPLECQEQEALRLV